MTQPPVTVTSQTPYPRAVPVVIYVGCWLLMVCLGLHRFEAPPSWSKGGVVEAKVVEHLMPSLSRTLRPSCIPVCLSHAGPGTLAVKSLSMGGGAL